MGSAMFTSDFGDVYEVFTHDSQLVTKFSDTEYSAARCLQHLNKNFLNFNKFTHGKLKHDTTARPRTWE